MRVRDVSTEGEDSGESDEKLRERRFQEQFGPIEPMGSPKKSEAPPKAANTSGKRAQNTCVSRVKFIIISINIKIEARDASIERRDGDARI